MTTTAMKFQQDRLLEDKFAKQIKGALGNIFITKDIKADLEQGTDFMTYQINPIRVAVRLRRKCERFLQYKKEFTIRWSRPSGTLTEKHKIKMGMVGYLFYGFVDDNKIIQYFVGDLLVFNQHYCEPYAIYPNKPYDSELAVWKLNSFPKSFIKHFYSIEPFLL